MQPTDTDTSAHGGIDGAVIWAAIEAFPYPIQIVDEAHRFIYANVATVQALGYSHDELLQMGPADIDKDILQDFWQYFHSATPGTVFGIDAHHVRKDGRQMPVRVSGAIIVVNGKRYGMAMAEDASDKISLRTQLELREIYQRTLLNNFPFVVWLKNRDSRLTAVNQQYAHFMGKTSTADFEGKTDFDFLPSDEAARYREEDLRVMQTGEHFYKEEHYVKDGKEVWMESWKAPIRFEDQVVGTLGYSHDVTERKEIENKLQKSLALLEGVINAFPDFLYEMDESGRFVNAWMHNAELLKQTREVVLGQSVGDIFSPENARTAMSAIEEAKLQGTSFGKVLRFDSSKGTRWFELSLARLPLREGAQHYIAVSRNVTQHMHMQATLERQEHEFRTLVENSPDSVARFDAALCCRYANPSLLRTIGASETILRGLSVRQLFRGEAGALMEQQLQQAVGQGQPMEFELTSVGPQQETRVALISLTPEFDASGQVVSVLMVGRDISELRAYQDKIHQMAFYDALTGQPNRVLFNDRLQQMLVDSAYHGQSAGVMMVDLDRFKHVNDTMGHAAGDALLAQVAQRLNQCVRSYDTVARMGGDEFGILLPRIRTGEHLARVASKVLASFAQPFWLVGKEFFATGSVGIAVYPQDSGTPEELVRFADSAMYHAKRAGRNGFSFYSKDMTDSAQQRLSLELDLRRALERKELSLHYQPKVELSSGRVVGCEALLRWKHPVRGMVSPLEFIPVAEDAGLINDIGMWVLREACKTASLWNAGQECPRQMAVNLSARQLQQPNWLEQVVQILQETHCRPEWLECEITESLLLDEDSRNIHILQSLRAMGISIAIDDFGTGYSALGYLSRFPIDTLKIDRSFIQSVTTDRYRAELVRSILSIARCLQQEVVAEGVETAEQANYLLAQGCQLVQGYLFSKPLPAADLLALPLRLQPL
ncbi:EAL domain-containing protein [Curvibacter sp. CHRR-16]|uniref:bifunctional diguanylate cyclase/phosphodiesterase n=1 Tax=Curvibacter sp. CHRR-16 TaxID=2835872 RepID=UPI001BDAF7EE|nr:EAL domain-containing protein [Curvibacter sp. CHRR-16]MBT0570532.1 EAL domain-containing protein [Curvibacter sp. CHRR-16]